LHQRLGCQLLFLLAIPVLPIGNAAGNNRRCCCWQPLLLVTDILQLATVLLPCRKLFQLHTNSCHCLDCQTSCRAAGSLTGVITSAAACLPPSDTLNIYSPFRTARTLPQTCHNPSTKQTGRGGGTHSCVKGLCVVGIARHHHHHPVAACSQGDGQRAQHITQAACLAPGSHL
jgi:hypothetical protein